MGQNGTIYQKMEFMGRMGGLWLAQYGRTKATVNKILHGFLKY